MNLARKKVAVLKGGPGSERAVSLASAEGVATALRERGAEVTEIDARDGNFLLPDAIDIAFIVVHGTFGEDGQLQRVLDARGIRYTGENASASELAFDKIATKKRFAGPGVPTPEFEIIHAGERPRRPLPLVIKAPREGSSVGVYIVAKAGELDAALANASAYDHTLLVEAFVEGRELTVGILGDQTLPIIEISPRQGFYDFKNKYPFLSPQTPAAGADHACPAALSREETRRVQETALRAHRALGLEVYSRVDLILTPAGDALVLEVNTIPGMTQTSLLPEAAAAAGIGYGELCERIIEISLAKKESR